MSKRKALDVSGKVVSLKEVVIANIRDAIITGYFAPGEKLIEKRLTEDMGVSRTILREALSHLSAEGIVKVIPNKGPVVRSFGIHDISNLYQIRMALLGLAARQFTQTLTKIKLKNLEKKLEKIKLAHRQYDADHLIDSKNNFYACLVDGSENEDLRIIVQSLESQISLTRSLGIKHPKRSSTRSKVSIENLQAAFNMIQAGNHAEAERMIRAETLQAQKEIISLIENIQPKNKVSN